MFYLKIIPQDDGTFIVYPKIDVGFLKKLRLNNFGVSPKEGDVYLASINCEGKIPAIKEIRSLFGYGLKEAKEIVDECIYNKEPVFIGNCKLPKGKYCRFVVLNKKRSQ